MPYTAGAINPQTGVPFKDEAEWKKWDSDQQAKGAQASSTAFVKAGDNAPVSKNDPWANYDWSKTISYGNTDPSTGGNMFSMPAGQQVDWNSVTPGAIPFQAGWNNTSNLASYNGSADFGYIDPATGKITFYDYNAMGGGQGAMGNMKVAGTSQYRSDQDYGLGQGNFGILPIEHDAQGTATKFYVATPTGGGKVVNDLATAQQLVKEYSTWYAGQHPKTIQTNPGTSNTSPTGTTGTSTTAVNPKNDLTVPQQGEQYFDSTKGFYTDPTRTSQVERDLKWDPTQPTDSEQHWAAVSGKYNDPNHQTAEQGLWSSLGPQYSDPNYKTDAQNYWNTWSSTFSDPSALDDMYKRAEQSAQTTLDRKASSGGWGDSGAAARATGNLGIQYQDAATRAKENWATTGMGLASASDTSRNAWANTGLVLAQGSDASENVWANTGANIAGQSDAARINAKNAQATGNLAQLSAASTADQANLSRITQGQQSANGAENLLISRATGNIGSALGIGNAEATIAATGLGQAEQSKLQMDLAALSARLQQGSISASQAQNEANSILATLGVVGKAADTIKNNLVQKKSDGTYYYAGNDGTTVVA